jgi:hypothetical protein
MAMIHLPSTLQIFIGEYTNRWKKSGSDAWNSASVRFYALRLREAGLIKSSPQKIIAGGTDWRFLDEVKRELKA